MCIFFFLPLTSLWNLWIYVLRFQVQISDLDKFEYGLLGATFLHLCPHLQNTLSKRKQPCMHCFALLWVCCAILFKKGNLLYFLSISPKDRPQCQLLPWLRNRVPHCRCEEIGGWAGEVTWPIELNSGQSHQTLQPLISRVGIKFCYFGPFTIPGNLKG